jgi:hypothetical protein
MQKDYYDVTEFYKLLCYKVLCFVLPRNLAINQNTKMFSAVFLSQCFSVNCYWLVECSVFVCDDIKQKIYL